MSRDKRIMIRYTNQEISALKQAAEAQQVNLSDYARQKLTIDEKQKSA